MGSRLLPLLLVVVALLADGAGVHRLASYVALLSVPAAAAAAFVAVADVLEGKTAHLRAITTSLALTLLVVGAAVRGGAPVAGAVPALAISAPTAAVFLYALPALGWLLQPLRPRPRVRPTRVRVGAVADL